MVNRALPAACMLVALILQGCAAPPRIRFDIAKVINAPTDDDRTRQMLDVDIVCVDRKTAEQAQFRQLVNGNIRSDEWFKMRQNRTSSNALVLSGDRILSFRAGATGSSSYTPDTVIGGPLVSGVDPSDRGEVAVELKDPAFKSSGSTILIYGRFWDGQGGLLPTIPVILKPPPTKGDVIIRVGRRELSRQASP